MEFLMGFTSAAVPWIGWASVAAFALIALTYLASGAQASIKELRVTCPESKKQLRASLKINIFKDPMKIGKGLDVIGCPLFSQKEVTCSKECLLTHKAQEFHRVALREHIRENRILALPKSH